MNVHLKSLLSFYILILIYDIEDGVKRTRE